MTEPELTDEQADELVGTVDDTDPIEVERGEVSEVPDIPHTWDSTAHAEEMAADDQVEYAPGRLEGDDIEES